MVQYSIFQDWENLAETIMVSIHLYPFVFSAIVDYSLADFCSPCSANDCHGACVCPVEKPEPGLLCDMCGGTGCPKCGCIPAPQQ